MIYIPVGNNQHAIIDDNDFSIVSAYKWYTEKPRHTFYAITNINGVIIRMHRLILGLHNTNKICDHADGNGLNNTRANIRICTYSQNTANQNRRKDNTTGFKGVSFRKDTNKFSAKITSNGKHIRLGCFETASEAYEAYCAAAKIFHGEFARFE